MYLCWVVLDGEVLDFSFAVDASGAEEGFFASRLNDGNVDRRHDQGVPSWWVTIDVALGMLRCVWCSRVGVTGKFDASERDAGRREASSESRLKRVRQPPDSDKVETTRHVALTHEWTSL